MWQRDRYSPSEAVDAIYLGLLGRPADPSGKQHYVSQIANGASLAPFQHELR